MQVVQDGALPLKKEDIRFTSVSVLSAYDQEAIVSDLYELEWYRV